MSLQRTDNHGSQRRVVVTGMGTVTPFGCGVPAMWQALTEGATAVRLCPMLTGIKGLRTTVAATVPEVDGRCIDRKKRRYMSNMSIYAVLAAYEAIRAAGLTSDQVQDVRTGVCVGSTTGSTSELEHLFWDVLKDRSAEGVKSTHFFKIMNSSCAANLAQALGVRGRLLAPSGACATGTIAIGLGAESIALGRQDVMICGGADELHALTVGVFDTLEASSRTYNDRPELTPRPFDRDRDGIVCGEGAGIVILESVEHACARNATILGEIVGFAASSSPEDIANPGLQSMVRCMETAVEESGLRRDEIGYLNAHATGTVRGDSAECEAVDKVFGRDIPVSSLKGHMGHTMAACGALELIATLLMLREGVLLPTRNLCQPDDVCGRLNLLTRIERRQVDVAISNNFALGGVNSAVVIRRSISDRQ
ncbi:MAG: beta-ketoacyl-[acyl-carrier-protein] synthase family protein [Sedimentisphaerales bacterium]|nr:beta-ketoacyl-[acyl-carrier-protein] synthase family protein [Sedimentisphaerales bacterium]